MTKNDILRKIELAEQGRELWTGLIKNYGVKDEEYVLLFPSVYDEWAYFGALYIDDFLGFKASKRAVVLCFDEEVKSRVKDASRKSEIVDFSSENVEKLIAFYSLYTFTDNLVIVSPDKPAGRNGRNVVGVKGVTIEEVVAIGIYGLKKIKE